MLPIGPAKRLAPEYTAVHCGHHKCLTVLFSNVLRQAAGCARVAFHSTAEEGVDPDRIGTGDYLLVHDSRIDLDGLGSFRATYVIRDPRDLVVSGYFYHLRTTETWCTRPNPDHHDLPADVSYQQHLRSLSIEEGLCYEMSHVSGRMIEDMASWDYTRDDVLELRFEDIVGNERPLFERIFRWYGVGARGASKLAGMAERHSLRAVRKRQPSVAAHARPGSYPGQWRACFTDKVKALFKQRYGQVPVYLGYEARADW